MGSRIFVIKRWPDVYYWLLTFIQYTLNDFDMQGKEVAWHCSGVQKSDVCRAGHWRQVFSHLSASDSEPPVKWKAESSHDASISVL